MADTILDEMDQKILKELTADAEKPYAQIAKSLNVSNSLIHQRISRLKQLHVIEQAEINLNERNLGYQSSAFTGIILKEDPDSSKVVEALKQIPEIVECYYVSGTYSLFVKILAFNNDHLWQVLHQKIDAIKGITRTETLINFGTVFKHKAPVPEL